MLPNGSKKTNYFDRNGFDVLQKDFKASCQFTRVLIGVLQERAQLENDFAKGLSKLHSRLSKAVGGLSGSVANGWIKTIEILETEAKAHQQVAERISSQLLPPPKAFMATVDRDLKPISSEVDAASSRLQATRREEWKSHKKAFTAYLLTCQNLSTNNNNSSNLDGGGIDSVSRTSTLLLRKRNPQVFSSSMAPPPSSTNSPFRTAMRSASLRRVATLSTTHPSMEIASGSETHSALPAKAARSVWRAVYDLYRSSLASEEARIEWHSMLYQNTFKLFDLERLRLNTMEETLNFYRSTIIESVDSIGKTFQATKDVSAKASAEEDFLSFHAKVVPHANTSASHQTSQSALTNSRLTGCRGPHRVARTPPLAVVGSTQQNLLCLPGEEDSLYAPSAAIQRQSIRQALQKRFLVFPQDKSEAISSEELADSVRKSEKAAFARQLLTATLDILSRECQKEERTKQGLTNLVQVYSTRPIFTDDATLIEARRRLFFSRCRLAHLLACRARLACLFHLLSPNSPPSTLQTRLSEVGFSTDSLPAFCRRVDVATPPTPPSVLLEWPPVSSEVTNLEDIPITELEVANPLLASDMARFSWMAHTESLFSTLGSTGRASSLDDEDGIDEDVEEEAMEVEVAAVKKPPPVITNGSVLRAESGQKKAPAKPAPERPPVRSGGSAARKNLPPTSSTPSAKSPTATSSRQTALPARPHSPPKLRSSSKAAAQPVKPPPPATTAATTVTKPTKVPAARRPVGSASRQPERKPPSTKDAPSLSKSKLVNSRSKSLSKASTITTAAFSPVLDETDAFMDEEEEEEGEEKRPPLSEAAKWQSAVQTRRRLTLEHVNECGDLLAVKAKDEAAPEAEEAEKTEVDSKEGNTPERRKNVTALFSRLGIRGGKQQKSAQRPEIVTPWRVEPTPTDSLATPTSPPAASGAGAGAGPVSAVAASPPRSREAPDPLQMWPSLASLHCIGWAKVISDYAPQKAGELALLEGEIVSILQKTTSAWWIGEAGGKSGRFPVTYVEEF